VNIIVLIKQVPEIALIKVDSAANQVVLPQGPGIVNPFDEYAVEEGLRLREKLGGTCSVMTVGTERAESALRDCLALGVDDAYLLVDDKFNDSDPQGVAKILAAGISKIGNAGIILAGKQAVDSDSSQVPGAVAAQLDWPQVLFVKKIEQIDATNATVFRATEDGYDVVEVSLPAVFSVVKEINEPRLPSLKGKMAAKKKEITKWSAADIGFDGTGVGSNSGTKSIQISEPPARTKGEVISGDSPEQIADALFAKLRENQVI
jgi:electron transfer flavoprotein beta subunit